MMETANEVISMTTDLYPRTRKEITDLWESINSKLNPWRFFSTGKLVKVTNYYGKPISIGGDIEFEGTPRLVFWDNFIEPFLQEGIINILDQTAETCKQANLNPEPYIEETAVLLDNLIQNVYSEMADIDQNLRGKGFPHRASRKQVKGKIKEMQKLLEGHKTAAKLLYTPRPQLNPSTEDIVNVKPNFYGIGLNLNEVWRRIRKWSIF